MGGVIGGLVQLWLRGALFVLDGSVTGYHWPEWLHNAWHVAHGRWDRMSGFRKPLHGYLVGMVGEAIGYADAAIIVSSVSATAMVVAAGVLGRVLAGPAAGGLAALSIGTVPLVANSAHWGTGYPLLAAGTGMALATSALFAARPGRHTGLAMVLGTSWALASEDRGMLVLPWVLAMAALAWPRTGRPRVLWWVLGAAFIAAVPPSVDHVLGHRAPFALSSEAKREAQKEVVFRWLRIEPAPEMVQTCAPIQVQDTLEPGFFQTPCAQAVLRYNSTSIAPKATFFSATALGIGVCMWGIGGAARRRRLVWAGLATGGLVWAGFAAATPMPHRYILQFVVPLAVVVPVGLGRVCTLAGPRVLGWVVSLVVCGAAGAWTFMEDPHDRDGSWQQVRGDWSEPHWVDQTAAVRAQVPANEAVLDCADHGINSALLPENVVGPAPFLSPNTGFCRDWVSDPTRFGAARRWVVVSTTEGLFDSGRKETVYLDRLVAETAGWTHVVTSSDVALWTRER